MDSRTRKLDSGVVIYDADCFSQANLEPDAHWFEPRFWREQGGVVATPKGRGTALVIDTPVGRTVLRQYLRGGRVAKFVRARYVFTGYANSRPFREFRVLQQLSELGLPAPPPVAALCVRHGLVSSGALMTMEIRDADTIEAHMDGMDAQAWHAVGQCIRRFHDHGLVHADLTVRNILMRERGEVFLVDFDRANFQPGASRAFKRNLQRLLRSLRKTLQQDNPDVIDSAWTHLLKGYGS